MNSKIGRGPEGFYEMCPGEQWSVWCHRDIVDFEMDSFGATAGFFVEGTPVKVLEKSSYLFQAGPMKDETRDLLRVRGIAESGKRVTGWVLADDVVEVQVSRPPA